MAEVESAPNESFDSLLKRFNKRVQRDGILSEMRHREHYEKPSVRRKRKDAARRRKLARVPGHRSPDCLRIGDEHESRH